MNSLDDGLTIAVLKPGFLDFEGRPSLPLVESLPGGPRWLFGKYHSTHTTYEVREGEFTPDELDELQEEACATSRDMQVEQESVELAGLDVWMVYGHPHVAAKLLDTAFMNGLHERFGPLLAISIPTASQFLVYPAVSARLGVFANITEAIHEGEDDAISPLVFAAINGRVDGTATYEP